MTHQHYRRFNWAVPTVTCTACGESFAQDDGPVCPLCGHDHREDA